MTLLVPDHIARKQQREERLALTKHFNEEMEKILNANKVVDNYYILGKVRFPPELGGQVGRVFLEACMERPVLIKGTFVYEVDNRRGAKQLLWTCDNNNLHIIPTNKRCPVSPA